MKIYHLLEDIDLLEKIFQIFTELMKGKIMRKKIDNNKSEFNTLFLIFFHL